MKISFVIAAWCMILFGVIHEATFVYSYIILTDQEPVVQAMKHFPIVGTPTHLYSFYNGYALMMGLLLVSFGVGNLILIRGDAKRILALRSVMMLNIVVSLVSLLLSIVYFSFIVPVVLTGLALVFFSRAYYLSEKTTL